MNIKELNKILSQHGIEPLSLAGNVKFITNRVGCLSLYPERVVRKKDAVPSVGTVVFHYPPFRKKGPTPSPTVLTVNIYPDKCEGKYKELCTELFLHDVFRRAALDDYMNWI